MALQRWEEVGSSLQAVAAKPMPTVSKSHQAALTGLTDEVRVSNASVLQEVQRMLSTSREVDTSSLSVHHNDVYEEELLEEELDEYEQYDTEYQEYTVQKSVRTSTHSTHAHVETVQRSSEATVVTNVTNTVVQQQQTRRRSPSPHRTVFYTPEKQ